MQQQPMIRHASKADARQLAKIYYKAYRLTESWSTIFPIVDMHKYLESQTNLCLQYFGSTNNLVLIVEDAKGEIVGGLFGRVLTEVKPDLAKPAPLVGKNEAVVAPMDSTDFIEGLVRLTHTSAFGQSPDIHHFAVLPDKQGAGFGKALMDHVVSQARRSENNIALAGTEEAVGFYKRFGFVEVTPAETLDGVKLTNRMLLELFPGPSGRAIERAL
ncbi:hypothetical protein QFC22_000799 [Naganishia vaughanmartiniae]|uniref:Uncharacterized protein n=1 Tax=Naganishia vaughanmartiniae TaxID=1424756 RepID=A0ACC2XMS5_9TREE|nr:hypothetical protein QFC22_000799 [Naganishia vaughanmartiniae]